MATANKRPKAVFPLGKLRKIGDFILRCRTIVLNIGNNATLFVTPNPALATITTNINNLETAEGLAGTRVAGSASARDLKYDIVLKNMRGLENYVQNLADNAADEPTSINIINASGFDLKNAGVRSKNELTVKNGEVSGTVILIAKSSGNRVSYNWQKSADGISWEEITTTLQTKTIVTDLTPTTVVYFRFRAITKSGANNWCQAISVIVL